MADITLDCPHCGQNIEAPAEMVGAALDCPACGGPMRIPEPEIEEPDGIVFVCPGCSNELEAPGDMIGSTINCPKCGSELIVPGVPPDTQADEALASADAESQAPGSLAARSWLYRKKLTEQDVPKRAGSKLHFLSTPTVVVILLCLALPWISVSCGGEKTVAARGYELCAPDNAAVEGVIGQLGTDPVVRASHVPLLAFYVPLVLLTLVMTVMSILAGLGGTLSPWNGIAAAILSLVLLAGCGFYYGVQSRAVLESVADVTIANADKLEDSLGVTVGSAKDLSIALGAGYYASFAAVFWGLAWFAMPLLLSRPRSIAKIIAAAIIGLLLTSGITTHVIVGVRDMSNRASVRSLKELRAKLAGTGKTTGPTEPKQPRKIEKLSQAFFDFYLGEKIGDAMARAENLAQSDAEQDDPDHPGILWDVPAEVIKNEAVSAMRLETYKKRVYAITVFMKNANESGFEIIGRQLAKKYGYKRTVSSAEARYRTVVDGRRVAIVLRLESEPDQKDVLTLTYVYEGFNRLVLQELAKRKGKRLAEDI